MRTLCQKETERQSVPQTARKSTSPEEGPEHQNNKSGSLEMGWGCGRGGACQHTALLCCEPLACIPEPCGPVHHGLLFGINAEESHIGLATRTKLTALWFLPLPPAWHFPTAPKAYPAIPWGNPRSRQHPVRTSSGCPGEIGGGHAESHGLQQQGTTL